MKNKINLTFRKVTQKDLPILRDWRNSKGILEYNTQFTLLNMKSQENWFKQIKAKNSDRIMFMIISNNQPVGVCGLIHVDKKERNADVAIIIGKKTLHGKGLGKKSLQKLVEYGFNKLKLHRIGAEVFEYNNKSIKLFKKMNFKYDALLRDSLWRNSTWWNTQVFSLLKEDFNKL